tara:strand:+ start:2081 stop:2602 length:522 start_codon:yes stop_codon:yes gene_type:complete
MSFKLIVAVSKNYGIGINNTLPWNIKEDLKHFSKTTKGNGNNAIVMGRNTWNSFNGRYLKKRDHLILSTSLIIDNNDNDNNEIIKTFSGIDNLIEFIKNKNYDDVWIIGGETIYKTFIELNLINECYITFIDNTYECDTYFPYELIKDWKCEEPILMNTENDFNVYIKKFYKS